MSPRRKILVALATLGATVVAGGGAAYGQRPIAGSDGASLTIAGRGRGHGVGGSLDGYENRARAGQTVATILSVYFPGTQLRGMTGSPMIDVGVQAVPLGSTIRLGGGRGDPC